MQIMDMLYCLGNNDKKRVRRYSVQVHISFHSQLKLVEPVIVDPTNVEGHRSFLLETQWHGGDYL